MAEDTKEPPKNKIPELTPEKIKEQEDAKKAEIEKLKAEEKQREFVEKKLKESDFKEVDFHKYSFVFDGGTFVFRIENLLEKTQIKFLLSKITSIPGSFIVSSTHEIEGSGDFDLLCAAKLLTHTQVLMDDSPKGFDANKLGESESFELGNLILLCEREFIERKKKA